MFTPTSVASPVYALRSGNPYSTEKVPPTTVLVPLPQTPLVSYVPLNEIAEVPESVTRNKLTSQQSKTHGWPGERTFARKGELPETSAATR